MRATELFPGQERDDPNLQVVAEDDAGVTVSGMKMLATSAVYADEILIGNLTPIAEKFKAEAITAALPLNAPGLTLWSRQPYAQPVKQEADYPLVLSFRRDRQRAGLRPRQDPVGARVPAQRRRHVAPHLHRHAGELLPEPPFQHPLLGEARPDRRAREPHHPGERHRQGAGGARDARPVRGAGSDHRRAGAGPDRGVRGVAARLRHAQPAHHVCRAQLVPGAPHRDRRHAAHAARRHSALDAGVDRRDDRRRAARRPSSAGGRRRRSRRWIATSSTSSPGTSSAPNSPAATCCTRNSTPAIR